VPFKEVPDNEIGGHYDGGHHDDNGSGPKDGGLRPWGKIRGCVVRFRDVLDVPSWRGLIELVPTGLDK